MRIIKTNLVILFMLVSVAVFGQNHIIGLRSGIGLTNVKSDISHTQSLISANLGMTYNYRMADKWNLGIGLHYNRKGFNSDYNKLIFNTNSIGNVIGSKDPVDLKAYYLSIPISIGVQGTQTIAGFCNLAIAPSFLIDAKETDVTQNYITIDVSDKVTKFDFVGLLEIGTLYQPESSMEISLSLSYQQGFKKVTNSDYYIQSNVYHYGFLLSIGIKYDITKE